MQFSSKSFIFMCLTLASCGSMNSKQSSETKDVGVVNALTPKSGIIYSSGNTVYLRVCDPILAKPSRTCGALNNVQRSLPLETYITRLNFKTGPYLRNQDGLNFVSKALQDAKIAVSTGNMSALITVQTLEPIKKDLEMIVKIRKDLGPSQLELNYYQYQAEFSTLLYPFGSL